MTALQKNMELFAKAEYQKEICALTPEELHHVVARTIMAKCASNWATSQQLHADTRRACYFSAEFLVGRAVFNNLLCCGVTDEVEGILEAQGVPLKRLEHIEDALLGNGGLGRLAACFLDSAATLNLPLDGYGIRYRSGLFRQEFQNGFQVETVEDWLQYGDPWSVCRKEDTVTVHFADGDVLAVPYDMPVIGYGTNHVSTLRLWQCEPTEPFDFALFNEQKYDEAMQAKNAAENISRVLYPNDSTREGKLLRLRQQYFFCSASLQNILKSYTQHHGRDYRNLSHYVTVQLNDTHPVISVPELIRLLTQDGVSFSEALQTAKQVFNYTNHTVMQEALETWDFSLIEQVLPEVAAIIQKIDAAFQAELKTKGNQERHLSELQILQNATVHMAYLACYTAAHINGVAQLHTEILKQDVLRAWYTLYPEKFCNKTNGITQRRWLYLCNPELSALISRLLGNTDWITNLDLLRQLEPFAQDEQVLQAFRRIKQENKLHLCRYMEQQDGLVFDTNRMLDVQIKRLHEYKRQFLNILAVLELYFEIREGTLTDFAPTTFLFGAKAAPGYLRAKAVIKLIHAVGDLIDSDDQVRQFIQVVFVPDYNVSYAEKIVAAADVSEQISTAGTEASGTGNMKLMLNGAVTLGTYDGANIEIVQEAGEENNYIFGARVEEIEKIKSSYNPLALYKQNPKLKRCLDALTDGTLSDDGMGMFKELRNSLLEDADWHRADQYYLLLDFEDYLQTKIQVNRDYSKDADAFTKKCWMNLCNAGKFSSDRTVQEYADEIWNIHPVKL